MKRITMSNLEGRFARCTCGTTRPSESDMGYFEYRGDGSRQASDMCTCGMAEAAHSLPFDRGQCNSFTPRGPMDYDSFFCGHLSGQ